jgi:hypothetical protein
VARVDEGELASRGLTARRKHVGRRHRAVSAERQLDSGRREPAEPALAAAHGRLEEGGGRPRHLHGDASHRDLVEAARIGHDRGRVAGERGGREDVNEDDLDRSHLATLAPPSLIGWPSAFGGLRQACGRLAITRPCP